jgi:MFS family permease
VIVLLRREPEPPWIEAGPAARSGLRNVFALDLSRDRSFLLATAARFAFLLGIYAVGRFFVAYVADRRGLEAGPAAEVAGGVLAILALITALASLPAGVLSDRFSRPALMVSGAMLALLGIGFFAVAVDVSLMVAGGIAMAAGSALFGVANWATLLDLAPPAEAGRYLGLAQIGTAGAAATAGLFGLFVDAGQAIESGAGFIALFAAAAVATILAAGLAAAIYRPAITLVRQET